MYSINLNLFSLKTDGLIKRQLISACQILFSQFNTISHKLVK